MRLVERYIASAVIPYAGLAFLIFTVMLLMQQAGRIGELLTISGAPLSLSLEILIGLLPNVLIFTIPMSLLVGIATGLGRLAGDSELTALRASGNGHWRVAAPILLLGCALTLLSTFIGLKLAPGAVKMIREATLRAGVIRLESPVEPGVFNTEIPGKVIYVKEGDRASGLWQKVFIQLQETDRTTRLITAQTGRVDTSGERSELVLNDVRVTTLPANLHSLQPRATEVITEQSAQLRVRLDTGREALLKELTKRQLSFEEMGWRDLRTQMKEGPPVVRRDAIYVWHRRLALCFGPLSLTVLGLGIGLRTRRGGRGTGILLSLLSMLGYYLTALGGEALSRTGSMPPFVGAWLATSVALIIGVWLLLRTERSLFKWDIGVSAAWRRPTTDAPPRDHKQGRRGVRAIYALGLLDASVLRTLTLNFSLSFLTLICVFLIFTLFELWRFIVKTDAGAGLVARYLALLTPLAAVSLAPVSILIALLVTYALMARRSEAVAWWAGGHSLYRLALPGLMFSVGASFSLWLIQENILPNSNRAQERLRAQIRGGDVRGLTAAGRHWLALKSSPRLYAYDGVNDAGLIVAPVIYFFEVDGAHLTGLWAGAEATPMEEVLRLTQLKVLEIKERNETQLFLREEASLSEPAGAESFKQELKKPLTLNRKELSDYIKVLNKQRGTESTAHRIAFQRRITDPLSSIIMAMIGIPLGLAFGRRSAMATLSVAVVIGLGFWGTVSAFQLLGSYNLLPPAIAAWMPIIMYSSLGAYFLSQAKT